ncbi:MAG TPA: heavy metal translocating P-type ATPase [Polyangiaceae bacterium]
MVEPRSDRAIASAISLRDERDRVALRDPVIRTAHETGSRLRLRLEGGSDDDAGRLAEYLRTTPGVLGTAARPHTGSVIVRFDGAQTSASAVLAAARTSRRVDWPEATGPTQSSWPRAAFDSAVLLAAATAALPTPLTMGAVAFTALPTMRRAMSALARSELTVDTLDFAAIVASLATSRYATAAFMTWLLTVGDLLLERTTGRARHAITSLMHLEVADAWRLHGDARVERVSARTLVRGDRIVVYTGERVPADGTVLEGTAVVDEKALTGESLPRERNTGGRVLAASVVVEGRIVLSVDRAGTDTVAARIVHILQGAGSKPMTLQKNVERAANRLVLPTVALAVLAALATGQVDRMTSVLITDFGTGIRIAIPTTVLTAMTLAAREGLLVKGGHYLERLARADAVVFDKTGTLTRGEPVIVDARAVGTRPLEDVAAFAAAAEAHQHHPVALAVRRWAAHCAMAMPYGPAREERASIGKGVCATVEGRSVVVGRRQLLRDEGIDVSAAESVRAHHRAIGASSLLVAIDGRLEAVLGYADEPRAESGPVVATLRGAGRREVVLMSGDVARIASSMGARLGLDRAIAELLPEDKAREVRAMQAHGRVVAMVGDGINDAPALALSDVGISLRGSTEVALETADVILLEGGLARLPRVFELADAAMHRARAALTMVIAPNVVAIALGALGLMPPALAATVNNGSTVLTALWAVSPLFTASRRQSRSARR